MANLLAKGNPLAAGVGRRNTVKPQKEETEEVKEKIKFDIFDDEGETNNEKYKKGGPTLDNVSLFSIIYSYRISIC